MLDSTEASVEVKMVNNKFAAPASVVVADVATPSAVRDKHFSTTSPLMYLLSIPSRSRLLVDREVDTKNAVAMVLEEVRERVRCKK